MPDSSWPDLPALSRRRSPSLSSLTSFSSSMSIFQPTPPLGPATPPMPIPDTFELDSGQDEATSSSQMTETPTTPTMPPLATVGSMPATPPPSATRSSRRLRDRKTSPTTPPPRPTKPRPLRPARATAWRGRTRPRTRAPADSSPCPPRGRKWRSPGAQGQKQPQDNGNKNPTTVAAVQHENRALRRALWTAENANALLRARLLTGTEQVQHAHTLEAQLEHAQRYVRALRKQVRSLGGFVMGRASEDEDEDDENDGDDDSGDDGELPATAHSLPAYFPDAARHPERYTMLAMQREKALRKKTKAKMRY